MRTFETELRAVIPGSDEIGRFPGPRVKAFTRKLAEQYVRLYLPCYYYLADELVSEIPCKITNNGYEPDFDNAVDYDGFDPSHN